MQVQLNINQKSPCIRPRKVVGPVVSSRVFRLDRSPKSQVASAMKIIISGAPAVGKGTQCEKIVKRYKLVHISVGDILRAEVTKGTSEGILAKEFMDRGALVPDEVVVEMVKHRLAQDDVREHGWLLDGYPRTGPQADAIDHEGIRPDVFLLINVPDHSLVERVVGRRLDPITGDIYHLKFKPPPPEIVGRLVQRSDDTEEKFRVRLAAYKKNVEAVVEDYEKVLRKVDGSGSMDDVFARVQAVLDEVVATA